MLTISVRVNHTQLQNNCSPFGAFGKSTQAGFNVKTIELPRAGLTELAGRIWAAGRTLPTPASAIQGVYKSCSIIVRQISRRNFRQIPEDFHRHLVSKEHLFSLQLANIQLGFFLLINFSIVTTLKSGLGNQASKCKVY